MRLIANANKTSNASRIAYTPRWRVPGPGGWKGRRGRQDRSGGALGPWNRVLAARPEGRGCRLLHRLHRREPPGRAPRLRGYSEARDKVRPSPSRYGRGAPGLPRRADREGGTATRSRGSLAHTHAPGLG